MKGWKQWWKSLVAAKDTQDRECEPAARAAVHWNAWQQSRDRSNRRWHDWGEHPLILECIQSKLFGDPDCNVFQFLRAEYPQFRQAQALSLCCGDGQFERALVEQDVFGHVTGMDVAGTRIDAARALQVDDPARLRFVTGDVNTGDFGTACFDVVFAKAALHHVDNLEALFSGMRRCLKPGGTLVTIDFFGPTRFQWSDAQVTAATELLLALPPALRRRADGSIKQFIERPSVAEMIALDPSEAVRSAELLDYIAATFPVRREWAIGGTLLHLVFTPDILDNFEPDQAAHRAMVEAAFAAERRLLEQGKLSADFRFIVAR